jgi:hypothetical protein
MKCKFREHNRNDVEFKVLTAVTMKNVVFWDVVLCGSCKNRHFGVTSTFRVENTRVRDCQSISKRLTLLARVFFLP